MASLSITETYELQPTSSKIERAWITLAPESLRDQHQGSTKSLNNEPMPVVAPSRSRTFVIIFQLCMINFLSSFTNGVVIVGLPTIANSISLPRSLYLWPSSVYGLTCGATLLLAGAIADLLGARHVEILGCFLLSIFTLVCGFAQTGMQLVIFRALQGLATSMHLPSSVALVASTVPQGRRRNIGFSCLGLSQPLGFLAGLVISGVMIERVGWRSGFYLSGASLLSATFVGIWTLPRPEATHNAVQHRSLSSLWKQLRSGIDWIGALIASAGLAFLSYVLASLSANLSSVHDASTIVLLSLSLILLTMFPIWMRRREQHNKPALVPNKLWKKLPFTSTCIMVALSYGVMNGMELFSSLYFQEVQSVNTLFTSLRILPSLIVGSCLNLTVGFIVDRVQVRWLIVISSILCAIAPLLMAVVDPHLSYWKQELFAQILAPLSGDILFTVGLLIVSEEFDEGTQALAGAVFNTVAQFGMSLSTGIFQVIALGVQGSISSAGHNGAPTSVDTETNDMGLLKGYRASFWTMFAFMLACAVIGLGGLRKAGKVGVKRE